MGNYRLWDYGIGCDTWDVCIELTNIAKERNKVKHHLKIMPEYFKAIRAELKTFEIRKNDRNYQVGDTLVLKEYDDGEFTGNIIEVVVNYITDYAQKDNYIVMAIEVDF